MNETPKACDSPPHHWIISSPKYSIEGMMIYEATIWRCKKCPATKENVIGLPIEEEDIDDSDSF